ncbi:MAG: TerC family protein [Nonlabens sp.]|uniref:TerC family protein n=1 Tax=Nonlabens sp. TaxID=1888209 RepID=UPI003EF37AEF
MFEIFSTTDAWVALLALIFIEIILGIDNIQFITIAANKLQEKQRKNATTLGLALIMILRVALLLGIGVLVSQRASWLTMEWNWLNGAFTGQSLLLLAGGIFLIYKSTQELYEKAEDIRHDYREVKIKRSNIFSKVLIEIIMINIVFSFDSVFVAVGMTNGLTDDPDGALILMLIAVVTAVFIMFLFAKPIGRFVSRHPSVQVFGLALLLLIGFILLIDGAQLANLELFGKKITGDIPKGYLYFTIFFTMGILFLNFLLRSKKIKRNSITELLEEDEVIK